MDPKPRLNAQRNKRDQINKEISIQTKRVRGGFNANTTSPSTNTAHIYDNNTINIGNDRN